MYAIKVLKVIYNLEYYISNIKKYKKTTKNIWVKFHALIFMDMNKLRQYNKKLRGVGINMEGRPVYVEKVVLE
jgi:hypothetical protein